MKVYTLMVADDQVVLAENEEDASYIEELINEKFQSNFY